MNIESRADHANELRTHVVRGEFNLQEIKTFLDALYGSVGFDPTIPSLWDVREASFPDVTSVEIKDLAYFVRVHWAEKHKRKMAVVISGDLQFGLSRMFEQFIGPQAQGKIKTFRELQVALDWIADKDTAASLLTHG